MLQSLAERLLLRYHAKQTTQEFGEHHPVLCWRAIWRVRPPKSIVPICSMVRQWWVESALGYHCLSLPPCLTTCVPLNRGSLIGTKTIQWQMRLICFLCTVDWKHTDADCSCLFLRASDWTLLTLLVNLPDQEEMELPIMGTVQCGSMGFAAVRRQREINPVWQSCIFPSSRSMRWDCGMYLPFYPPTPPAPLVSCTISEAEDCSDSLMNTTFSSKPRI